MKTILVIILFSINLHSFAQNIDSLALNHFKGKYGDQHQNLIDSNGLKQGFWTHYSYAKPQIRSSRPELDNGKGQKGEPLFRKRSEGFYHNDKKVGIWEFYDYGRDQNISTTRIDFYDKNGSVKITSKMISKSRTIIHIINDSSEVKVQFPTRNYTFTIFCENQICGCYLGGEKLYEFELNHLELEMDKLGAGIYDRQIKYNRQIKDN